MKAVLIGSDFCYNKDGNLIPIEINTNVGMDSLTPEDRDTIFDVSPLNNLITSNNIIKITYVGSLILLNEKLEIYCSNKNITYDYINISGDTVIPFIEDGPEHLIIRSAWDSYAIVDTEYCANKIGFMNLIKLQTFGSQFAYKNENGIIINNITSIGDNGQHPNFIVKAIQPHYDKTNYPKLYKITNQVDLNFVINNIPDNHFIMEYYINPTKLYEGNTKIIRSFNLLVSPTLTSYSIGAYTRLASAELNDKSTFDTTTFELSSMDTRYQYITENYNGMVVSKLGKTDLIEMADETFKTGEDLQVGDSVKTILIANPYNVNLDNDLANYKITYEEFQVGSTFSSSLVQGKRDTNALTRWVRIIFSDGTFWADNWHSNYLILRNNEVRFITLFREYESDDNLHIGDELILVNSSIDNIINTIKKEVIDIVVTIEMWKGYQLAIDHTGVFLSKDGTGESNYMGIEHNVKCIGEPCGSSPAVCPKDAPYCDDTFCVVSLPSCL